MRTYYQHEEGSEVKEVPMKYDVVVQWSDPNAAPGYRKCVETVVVEATSREDAERVARESRPEVSRVFVDGVHGTAIAFR